MAFLRLIRIVYFHKLQLHFHLTCQNPILKAIFVPQMQTSSTEIGLRTFDRVCGPELVLKMKWFHQ